MALMMGAFYDALIDAGASEAKARAAAEEAAGTTEEFATIRRDIQALGSDIRAEVQGTKAELDQKLEKADGQLATLRWMMGFVLAFLVALMFMLYRVMPHS